MQWFMSGLHKRLNLYKQNLLAHSGQKHSQAASWQECKRQEMGMCVEMNVENYSE